MATNGRVKSWKELLERSSSLPVSYDRQNEDSGICTPFNFSIKTIEGITPKGSKTGTSYQVRLSLFDLAYKQFYGRTWEGPTCSSKQTGQKSRVNYNKSAYLLTSVHDESVVIVLEIVAVGGPEATDEKSPQQVGCGWGIFRLFQYKGDMYDSTSTSTPPTIKMDIYHGSPRALLFIDDPIESHKGLTPVNGCHVNFNIRTHKNLMKVQHLIPENVFFGQTDSVPGIAEGQRDPKNPDAGVDNFRRPRLLKSFPCYVERLTLSLGPSVDKFEEELCRQLNEDRLARENKAPDGASIQVLKRQLQVGLHNGLCYTGEPQLVNLSSETGAGFKRSASQRRGSAVKAHQRTASTGSGAVVALVHKGRIDLDGMVQDPHIVVVFTLLYEMGEAQAGRKSRTASMAVSSFTVAVRWAAWSPINNLASTDHSLQLLGGPGSNPDSSLMFQGQLSEALGSSSSLVTSSAGTLAFGFAQDKKSKEDIPPSSRNLQVPHVTYAGQGMHGSQTSLHTDGSSILQEVQQVSHRPPKGQLSSRPGTAGSMALDPAMIVPPLQGLGTSPPQTGYYSSQQMYQTAPGGYGMGPVTPRTPMYVTQGGYMPAEVHHVQSGVTHFGYTSWPQSTSRGVLSSDLHELPFVPVHSPIMATAPGMHSGQGLSRAAYAKLYTAGFPPILDRRGEAAEVVDPAEPVNIIPAKEEADKLQANEIILQFLAFARMVQFGSDSQAKVPSTVFFTFQFYRFPQVTSERLLLGNVEGELSADSGSMPCILQKLEKDGSVTKGPPGYQVKYHVDPAYLKPGEGRLFVQHLSQQTLHIDVWDGDSLLLIGSCAVDLKHLCRQSREGIQVTYELDVISTEYVEHDGGLASGDLTRDGSVQPADINTILKGRLHLRMANVGHPAESKIAKSDRIPQPVQPKVILANTPANSFQGGPLSSVTSEVKSKLPLNKKKVIVTPEGLSSFSGGGLQSVQRNVMSLGSTKVCKAHHVADTNQELAQVLFSRQELGEQGSKNYEKRENAERQRKVTRLKTLQQKHGEDSKLISTYRQEKEERSRDLRTISLYRDQSKREGILGMLGQAITTEHTIHPSMGATHFFEFVLKNPYNVQHTIVIEWDDPELCVVTDTREWRHLKMVNEVYTSVEENMFNTETKSGKPEIFLRPKESVNVPFKFLSFQADHSVHPQAPSDPHKPQTQRAVFQKKKEDPHKSRLIKVYFKTEENKPIAIFAVKVEPQPHVIDQTFRLHHPEQSFLKKSVRLPPLHTLPGVPVGGPGISQVFVRCSDPNVICDSKKVQPGEPHDVFLKVACGASPQIKRFFVAIYLDQFLTQPLQIWQFYTHSMQRVDVSCIEGQTSRSTLVLRGTQASRLVQCFSSHPSEMQIHPKEPFMLAANTIQEVHIGVRPQQPGSKFLYINVVDIEYHQLIRSWLVCVSCRRPQISKSFELLLPVGGGKGSNKKISFTNPYPSRKVFNVRTNRDDLLQFKESRLELGAAESVSIGLRFAPSMSGGAVQILVFINDEDDKNEETFCVRATYQ